MGKYRNYQQLKRNEREGRDYRIRFRSGKSRIAIIALHGGAIEPGTSEIADAVAGDEHALYCFEGLKKEGNADLHIPSIYFDEPVGVRVARNSDKVLTIHGCKGRDKIVYLGGRDKFLGKGVKEVLVRAGFMVRENPRFPGMSRQNICNRGRRGMGVQLEISSGFRRIMFQNLKESGRKRTTEIFKKFISALRHALAEFS